MYEILNRINGPEDVKKLSLGELETLSGEIREALFNRITKIGGHFGPNFGIVEAEIAMHYVFSSPIDKFVFDVSHQSYAHKILTGRKAGYIDDARFSEDSGYTNPAESEHDLFNVGHTSTSISLATGLCKARDVLKGKWNVVALIGDGSLSGGEALEGLNVAGSEIKSNLIIIVNDNQQSISETHGGLYKNLEELRNTDGKSEHNIFRDFGLDYIYEKNGNDIGSLIEVFKRVKDVDHPTVVHINTLKGKGYERAVADKETWHWTMPFNRETGEKLFVGGRNYVSVAHEYIMSKAEKDDKIVVVTPNMPMSMGLSPADRAKLGEQFVDVGIAEEQAVAMASGMAKGGVKPLVITNATFMQRAYDQISHDVCINGNHVTILLNYSAFDGLTDVTHLGIFALPIFTNIPDLTVLSPTTEKEFVGMLDWALDVHTGASVILIPGGQILNRPDVNGFDGVMKYKIEQSGEKVAIIALGDFYQKGESLAAAVEAELGFKPTLINPRVATLVDKETLDGLKKNHKVVVTLEDGVLSGGFGEKIVAYLGDSDLKVKNYGLNKVFYDRYKPAELLKELGITNENMIADIKNYL
ncbi:MAG: 1-deoxy-D-xylulose-5-phosphate synthase [Candidatus Borkfalkiaceae bacterium]|nr:1-deoxy-D-xylulose-5-phosphate synthase [Christensenellaceae bacterium]